MSIFTLESLSQSVSEKEIDTVIACTIDTFGRLVGKRMTGHYFVEHGINEMHFCDYLFTVDLGMEPVPGFKSSSWELGYSDLVAKPDLTTLRKVPWLEATALVLCDCENENGDLIPTAPRSVLKNQITRLNSRNRTASMASELEFYIFNETYESARDKDYTSLKATSAYSEDYHIFQTTKEESFIRKVRNSMDSIGIPIECSKGEWGSGQGEISFVYSDAIEMADRHVIYKNGIKEIAYLQGKSVTFMPKWKTDDAGSSCHIHISLWDSITNSSAFYDPNDKLQMSEEFKHFLAGLLEYTEELTYFFAPTVNSYKRFQGGTFAPTKAVWGVDNRTTGFRLVGNKNSVRIECRIPGADINPYLAFAAIIAAGLYGVNNKLELEAEFKGNAYTDKTLRSIPKNLTEAVNKLNKSSMLRAAFGDDVIDHYVHAGRWEILKHEELVTDIERRMLFEQI
jgi:glutamine synthetase